MGLMSTTLVRLADTGGAVLYLKQLIILLLVLIVLLIIVDQIRRKHKK